MKTKRRWPQKGAAFLCAAALLLTLGAAAGCGSDPAADPVEDPDAITDVETGEDIPGPDGTDAGETEAEGEFADLVGDWYEETGWGMVTVDENGGFFLDSANGIQKGYLVYTEEDGGMWESGPRYELYLENGEQIPGVFLAFDDNHPGQLAYAQGGGAQLFDRQPPAAPEGVADVSVYGAEDAQLDNYLGFDEFSASASEPQTRLVFVANGVVRDFKFLDLNIQDVDENGKITYLTEELYSQDVLGPWRPLAVDTCFYGDVPNNGISYVDGNGVTRLFTVSFSGEDGSLLLTEI